MCNGMWQKQNLFYNTRDFYISVLGFSNQFEGIILKNGISYDNQRLATFKSTQQHIL